MVRLARTGALVALVALAATFWVNAAGASPSLPCRGTISFDSDHGSVTNDACKGAHSVVATVQGTRQELVWVTVAHVAPTGIVSVHTNQRESVMVAYEAW
jgi:hypothetical protein